jgi:hypothetical protein
MRSSRSTRTTTLQTMIARWPWQSPGYPQAQPLRLRLLAACLAQGWVFSKGRRATIDCTVLNLSDLGACLKVESRNSRYIRSCA